MVFERENIIKYMRADSQSYLSKKNTDCLKGIFAVVVVLAHIRGRLPVFNDTVVGQILTASGYLAVAVFFFLSAYGLQASVDSKGVAYLQTFPRRRILPFYGTYLFVLMLYVLVYAWSGELNTVKPYILFRSLIFGGTLIENGWYLQTALLFYIMFWAIFRFGKTETLRMVMIVAGMVLYCLLCIWLGMGAYAYVSVFAFPMGFWWRKREKKMEALLSSRRRFWMSYAALFLVFCVTLIFGNLPIFTRAWMLAIRSVSAVAFVSVVLLTIRVIRIQFPVTEFLGEIHYEIYVIHGMFLNLFRNVIVVENDVLYIVLVFGCTFSSSYLLRPVIQRLSNRLKN